ncbi:SPOR domain-containing protein [Pseudodesulfovibrio sediminis]|uniref:Sporulation protein n=1 Tax=Pseudodesulfovibrio sediminis TaxID=2810563 RepID=A0ABN6ESK3_9BACT|nr:SPOR domain-containing protein [Pseudodesulfovibrio sediminis]BCS89337.1 sporulation protein [Pseudodesulfovibrio sediminis]
MAEQKEPKYKVKVPKGNVVKKTYDFSFSLSGVISATGVLVVALTFFFVMGILIGRGYRPEADIPQLEPIMPSKGHGSLADEKQAPTVLTPEELEYPDRLKASAAQIMDETAAHQDTKSKSVAPEAKPVQPKAVESVKTETRDKPVESAPVQSGDPVFDYVYQVASFKQASMAESLSSKLVASGLRTRIQTGQAKGTTWHRVQVLYHGTPASTADMKAVLAKHGIKKPLLKKKTAAQ